MAFQSRWSNLHSTLVARNDDGIDEVNRVSELIQSTAAVILTAGRVTLIVIGMLLAVTAAADDTSSGKEGGAPPAVQFSAEALLAKSAYRLQSDLSHPAETMAFQADRMRPIRALNFRKASGIARLSKVRGLALLTFADTGRTRLFLGVNRDGLVGLHFSTSSDNSTLRYLELARMPYIKRKVGKRKKDHAT